MEFSIKSTAPGQAKSGCAVVGVFEPRKLTQAAVAIDRDAKGYLKAIVERGDMEGKLGATLVLHHVPNVACERVMLVGLGPESGFAEKQYREAVGAAIRSLNSTGASDAALHLTEVGALKRDIKWRVATAVAVAGDAVYRFDQMKSKAEAPRPGLRRLALGAGGKNGLRRATAGLEEGLAVSHGVSLTKDLGNLPPNVCTPSYLAEQARELGKRYRMKVTVLERDEMEKLGMNALLAVAQGSAQPPKLIV
ncbi:MAG TPA: M17 family peptidase N-terminal domain-containing protein, partial [Burkholderiales bacterium]|nr:M17 family peptidase N-terminal domain-containing protein [Burkholderiales bacterium]